MQKKFMNQQKYSDEKTIYSFDYFINGVFTLNQLVSNLQLYVIKIQFNQQFSNE